MSDPNYREAIPFDVLRYASDVAEVLNGLPKSANNVEVDDVPIKWHDEVVGHLVISEIDGQTYEYAPVLRG